MAIFSLLRDRFFGILLVFVYFPQAYFYINFFHIVFFNLVLHQKILYIYFELILGIFLVVFIIFLCFLFSHFADSNNFTNSNNFTLVLAIFLYFFDNKCSRFIYRQEKKLYIFIMIHFILLSQYLIIFMDSPFLLYQK